MRRTLLALALAAGGAEAAAPDQTTWCAKGTLPFPTPAVAPYCGPAPDPLLTPLCAEQNPPYPMWTSPYFASPQWGEGGYARGVGCYSTSGIPAPICIGCLPWSFNAYFYYHCAIPWSAPTLADGTNMRDFIGVQWFEAAAFWNDPQRRSVIGTCPDPTCQQQHQTGINVCRGTFITGVGIIGIAKEVFGGSAAGALAGGAVLGLGLSELYCESQVPSC